MKTFYSLHEFLKSPVASKKFIATIGIFDGVHRGHQRIAKILTRKAKKKHFSALVITFHPHPLNVLNRSKKVPLLISLKHRLRLLAENGIDYAIVLRFDRKLARMSAAGFIEEILGRIRIDEIIVGRNFFFGRNKKGSLEDLKRFSRVQKYRVCIIDTIKSSGNAISSTRIRNLILKGDLRSAKRLLSRPVVVLGTVVRGHKRGRTIGFPTANIDPHHEVIPPSGVYAVKAKFKNKVYNGILNIGIRPTFKKGSNEPFLKGSLEDREPTIEVYIFDFDKPIYKEDLEIMFVAKIRKEKRFKNHIRLREQIVKDERRARQILC